MMSKDDCRFIADRGMHQSSHEVLVAILTTLLRIENIRSEAEPEQKTAVQPAQRTKR